MIAETQPTQSTHGPDGDISLDDPDPIAATPGTDGVQSGRELVVIDTDEKSDGWFYKFLTRIGLRSRGSLRDDLNEALAGEGAAGNMFSPEERAMLQNILRLREKRVEDVMVQRAEMHAVDEDISLGDLLQRFEETGHSRMPVYKENLDDPRGMVLVKDLLLHIVGISGGNAKPNSEEMAKLDFSKVALSKSLSELGLMRRIIFVPPSMLAADLMARMQATRTQMALVIDEYGGTDGLVSLEDIVEEVVGEIEDEHDDDDDDGLVVASEDGIWTVDARAELEKITNEIGDAFQPGEEGEDVETIGGLVYALAGHIPVRGEVVRGLPGFEFRILEADPRRIRRLQVVQTSVRAARRKAGKTQ